MEEQKTVISDVEANAYDAADMPFDFVEEGAETALLCESDPAILERISEAMQTLDYQITEAADARDALKKSRFHVYDVVILNEHFGTENPDANDLMTYLGALPMATRRQMFVVLTSDRFRTMDNMEAFNRSVNLIINLKNIDDFAAILKKGLADHTVFYQVFKESLRKMGKL
jgi:CheY-like chemotaxis protein